ALGELEQLAGRVRVQDSSADVEDGPLRRGDGLSSGRYLAWMATAGRFPSGEGHAVGVGEVELGLLHVARDVDEHRAAPARARDVEGGLEDLRQLAHV